MEAVRTKGKVVNHRLVIDLPKDFMHESVEIIVMPAEEKSKEAFHPEEYHGILSMEKKEIEINLKSLRSEWDRTNE